MTQVTKRINTAIFAGLVATATVLLVPQALADDRGGRGGHHGGPKGSGGEARLAKMFARIDSNSDGVLSLAEMTAKTDDRAARVLRHKDADDDGVLSLSEYVVNRRGEVRDLSAIANDIVQCVSDLKAANGNADIQVPSADQFQSPEARFAQLDSSGDGSVDLAELESAALAKATSKFDHLDSDGDAQVSKAEFAAGHKVKRATRKAIRQCVQQINDDEGL